MFRSPRWTTRDCSVRSNELQLGSDYRHVWLDIGWGHVAPFNGQLVWGYHINADNSGGRPQLDFRRQPCEGFTRLLMKTSANTRWTFPLSWESASRSKEVNGDDSYSMRISISHWLLAVLLLVPPLCKLHRLRRAYSAARAARMVATET